VPTWCVWIAQTTRIRTACTGTLVLWIPEAPGWWRGRPRAMTFAICGSGKRSVAINLKKPEGVAVVKELVSKVDVLIEPFRPGVMEKLGLGPSVLCELNPRLVYARMTGWGQTGDRCTALVTSGVA